MANPYLIGINQQATGVSSTLVITVGSSGGLATTAGDQIHIAANTSSLAQTVTGITDSKGNTYAVINSDVTQVVGTEWETTGATLGLNIGDTITLTFNGTGVKAAVATGIPGVTAGHDVAPTPVAAATGTTASITTGGLAQASEILIAVVVIGNQTTGPTWATGFTQIGSARQAGNPWVSVAYKQVSSAASSTVTANWTTSVKNVILMTSYKIPAAPPPSGLYLVGQVSAASGTNSLAVPVTTDTAQDDTLSVGVVAESGSVTGVTDTVGNDYALKVSEVVNTGDQLYVYESYGSLPLSSTGTNAKAGKVGSTTDYRSYEFTCDAANNASTGCVFTLNGPNPGIRHGFPNGTKLQLTVAGASGVPGGFSLNTDYYVVQNPNYATSMNFKLAASPGGAAIGGTGSSTGMTGAIGAVTELGSGSTMDSILQVNGFTGAFATGPTGMQKVYNNPGVFPTSFTSSNSQTLAPLVALGTGIWVNVKPDPLGTDATALHNMLFFWRNNMPPGAILKVVFHQEYGTLSDADFIKCYQNYYSTAHNLGVPVVLDAAGSQKSRWLTAYPGNAFVDEIVVDYYGSVWNVQTKGGTTNLDPVAPLRNLADTNGKPFGFGELGQAVWNSGATLTDALFIPYIQYVTDMMAQHLQDGFANSDVMWYSSYHGMNGNCILPGDWRIPYLQALYTQLTPSVPGTINVAYSGTASRKAAIVIGDKNVQSPADKAVGATGTTGTNPSVATGTLAQPTEHIIAFFTDLPAGGQPTLGDGLSAASTGVQAGAAGPMLKAGFKAVTSTASDTPNATIAASTSWSVGVVTHKQNVPIIVAGPGNGTVGQGFSFTATATGGSGTLVWSETGGLPPGLTLSSSGVLSGTPIVAGTYSWTLIVTDGLGLQGTLNVTQSIAPSGGGGGGGGGPTGGPALPTALPNNLLSRQDSDGEAGGTYTWQPFANASQPALSTDFSVDGTNSTMWSTLSAGDSQIISGLYPVQGGKNYIMSGFLHSNQGLIADMGIAWYDSNQVLIADVAQGGVTSTVAGGWTPLNFATVAPQGAAFAAIVPTVFSASFGQSFYFDLAYLAQADTQVLIDWVLPTYVQGGGAGSLFMDVSAFVRMDVGINYTRGRQDAFSQVQPGSASFVLQNDQGSWTRMSNISIPAATGGVVSLQQRVQINIADENGDWTTRFDGSISQIDYTYDATGNTSTAGIQVSDVLAALNRQDPLFCWTKEQVLADSPTWHWTLDDPGNTGGTGVAGAGAFGAAAETAGSNGPPMRLVDTDSTNVATIAWQDTSGGVETLANAVRVNAPDGSEFWTPGVNQPASPIRGLDSNTVGPFTTPLGGIYLTPVTTAQSSQNQFIGNNGYYLQAELPQTLATNNPAVSYAFECWFTMDPYIGQHMSANYGPYIQLSLGSSRQKATLVSGVFLNAGALKYEVANYNQPPAFLGLNWPSASAPAALSSASIPLPADTVRIPHHLVLNVLGKTGPGLVQVYLDGVLLGQVNLVQGQVFDTIAVGAAYGGAGAHFGGIQLVSVYPQALAPQTILLHTQLGQYGMWEQTADDTLAQVSSYANLPAFWSNLSANHVGLTLMEYMDITGTNALTAMQMIAQAEQGFVYTDSSGAVNFHTRDWRMGHGPPDLVLPPGSYSPDLNFAVIDQFMCNEMGVAGTATTGASGQQGASLSTNTGDVQQPTDAVNSANIQTGFINTASQEQYGIYASNPVSSPVSLPLITWSRAYAQLGIPSLSFWPDPNLIDVAAWNSNSRSDPWLFPASLTIDLMTLDPTWTITTLDPQGNPVTVPLGVSFFYGLEIDDLIAPDTTQVLPVPFPSDTGSTEWFIEGITETKTENSWTLQFYVSPAEAQRAWIPGDPVYGVLGETTRIGISQADVSTPQADGKDVSHDAGPPYWPPVFSIGMNNPSGSGNFFVGAQDMRGINESLRLVLQPPMCIVSATSQTQSFGTGALANPAMNWDVIHVDTTGGMGLIPGYPNWYVCTVPGFYEISASLVWSLTTAQAGYTGMGWIAIAQGAAQALGAGLGTPLNIGRYICPVGEQTRWNGNSMTPVSNAVHRVYLGIGDMVALCGEHNYTSSRGTSTGSVGSHMSIRFVGLATKDDRTEINSSLAFGGTVNLNPVPAPNTFTFNNTHTYSYQGKKGFSPYARRNTDLDCFQGVKGTQDSEGSQTAQVKFNAAFIASQLTGKTIKSATLHCSNLTSWYNTGTKLMLGYTTQTPGASSYQPDSSTDTLDVIHQKFNPRQNLTFSIPTSMITPFVTGGATALVLGDSTTTNLDYYGTWKGGPGAWTLVVNTA